MSFLIGVVIGIVAGKYYPQLFAALKDFYDRVFRV